MGWRRLFIIRKDLHLTSGKLAAMVAHCAEGYWTHLLQEHVVGEVFEGTGGGQKFMNPMNVYRTEVFDIDKDMYEQYIKGAFVKTICQAKNLNQLKKAEQIAIELGLKQFTDYDYINDKCLTELVPENADGTTTAGIWFKPLPDEVTHKISSKFHLYMD